eukprot:Hpha_TRINITY_DN4276_c0_g1::TRINITY_DN4276_c0_g1_i1::g.186594::m.186594
MATDVPTVLPTSPTLFPTAAGHQYSSEQLAAVDVVVAVSTSLSLFGSLTICATYFVLRKIDEVHINLRLLVWLSLSDIVQNIIVLASLNVKYGDPGCGVVAFLETAADLSTVLWTAAMSCALWYTVFRRDEGGMRGDAFIGRYCLFCFGVPLLVALCGVWFDVYGRDHQGNSCWVGDPTMRLVFFFIPLWVVVAFNTVVYAMVHYEFKRALQRHKHPLSAGSGMEGSKAHRLKYYPAVLAFTWLFGTINRFMEACGQYSYPIYVLHHGLGRSQGLWNLLVYGADPMQEFRSVLIARLRGHSEPNQRSTSSGLVAVTTLGQSTYANSAAQMDLSQVLPENSFSRAGSNSPQRPTSEGGQRGFTSPRWWDVLRRSRSQDQEVEMRAEVTVPEAAKRKQEPEMAVACLGGADGDDFSEISLSSPKAACRDGGDI